LAKGWEELGRGNMGGGDVPATPSFSSYAFYGVSPSSTDGV
jgi:hypothetical protein